MGDRGGIFLDSVDGYGLVMDKPSYGLVDGFSSARGCFDDEGVAGVCTQGVGQDELEEGVRILEKSSILKPDPVRFRLVNDSLVILRGKVEACGTCISSNLESSAGDSHWLGWGEGVVEPVGGKVFYQVDDRMCLGNL